MACQPGPTARAFSDPRSFLSDPIPPSILHITLFYPFSYEFLSSSPLQFDPGGFESWGKVPRWRDQGTDGTIRKMLGPRGSGRVR